MFDPLRSAPISIGLVLLVAVCLSADDAPKQPKAKDTPSLPEGALRQFGASQEIGAGQLDLRSTRRMRGDYPALAQTVVALHPDGKQLLIANQKGQIDLWEIETGRHVRRIKEPGGSAIQSLVVSPNGQLLAWGQSGHEVKLWDLQANKADRTISILERAVPDSSAMVQRISFSADGKTLFASIDNNGVTALEVSSGKRLWNFSEVGYNFATDPRGRWLGVGILTTEPARLLILEQPTGKSIREMPIEPSWATVDNTVQLLDASTTTDRKFTPDGTRLVTSHDDATTRVWDVATGRELIQIKWDLSAAGTPGGLACSPDSRWAAIRQNNQILIAELMSGVIVHTLPGTGAPPREFEFTLNNRCLISNALPAPMLWSLAPKELPALSAADSMWETLASTDGPKAYRLQWALARDPKAAIELLAMRVKPDLELMPRNHFDKLVAGLDSSEFAQREKAEKELVQAGIRVPTSWLQAALNLAGSEEVRARLARLVTKREKPNPAEIRLSRAVQILELAGTDEAKKLLKTWSTSESPDLAADAKATLERLKSKP